MLSGNVAKLYGTKLLKTERNNALKLKYLSLFGIIITN